VLHVDEDRVMLARPAPARLAAVVVGPDDLVEKALAAEERVEENLGVVRLAIVEMQIERAVVGEQPPRLLEARLEELPVVLEAVVVAQDVPADALVPLPLEPDDPARLTAHAACRDARLA